MDECEAYRQDSTPMFLLITTCLGERDPLSRWILQFHSIPVFALEKMKFEAKRVGVKDELGQEYG